MDMIRKVITCEVKEVAPRVLEFVGSTEDVDRMGDVIIASGWQLKDYKKNPVFLWAHQYDMPPVGKATKVWIDEDKLKFNIQFPMREEYEFADTIYKLYKGGYLRASSVGFMPIKSEPIEQKEDEDVMIYQPTRYLKQDLLELSGCPVPANPNALAEAKTKGLVGSKELELLGIANDQAEEKPYPNEHACRLRDPGDFQDDSFKRTKRQHEGKEYSVIMGKLKGENTMTEQAYRYDKQTWTAKEASAHCKEHKGSFEPAEEAKKHISQEQLSDDLDYMVLSLNECGLSKVTDSPAWELVRTILRLSGDDIPVDILEKIGAVLNKKNRERLEQIQGLAQEVLDSAEPVESPKPEDEKGLSAEEVKEIVQQSVSYIIAKAQGKLNITAR